ncbi:MAG: D-alanyl-D-alanine carboxypeptidase/D-alanyl-D-alanine-endopeptidase [Bacteroidia bacterium]
MRKVFILFISVIVFSFKADQPLCTVVDGVANRHSEATFGFYAYDIDSEKGICAYNSDKNLAPASTLKLLTTLTALEVFGAESTPFHTQFQYKGKIENGTLKGDVIVSATGDFTMGSRYFDRPNPFETVANKMKEKGINKIDGKIILDLNGFEEERIPANWSFDDLGNYYGASLAPFNWSDNTTFITFKSGAAGEKTEIINMTPPVSELEFDNQVLGANIRYDNAYVYGAPRQYNRCIRGQIPANRNEFKIKASVPEPELFGMQCFVANLREMGIDVPYGAVSIVDDYQEQIADVFIEIISPTMSEIIAVTNMESNNLFAEGLLKAIAHRLTGEWSRTKGVFAVKDFWKEKGIDLTNTNLYDGSGLSRFNGISPKQLVELLKYEAKSDYFEDFKSTLPIAGVSGSLKTMLRGTKAENNLIAKSGYIEKVRGYCGYVTASNGNLVAFSVVVNNYHCSATEARKELELIMKALAN